MKRADRAQDDDALARLAQGSRIAEAAAVVIAHPDDESIGLAGRLRCFDALTLILVTDGAPRNMSDAWRIGFLRRRSYAETRRKELRAALAAARADPRNLKFYNVVDSSAAEHLTDLCDRLIHDLAGVAIVITHAYEGGHPDHDACAFAVQVACTRLGAAAPLRLEFAGYTGRRPPGEFWPDSRSPEVVVPMTVEEQRLKQAALAAHATKKLTWFPTTVERYRKAPLYDFTRPPTDEEVSFGQSGRWISGETWRKHASRALERLGQEQP